METGKTPYFEWAQDQNKIHSIMNLGATGPLLLSALHTHPLEDWCQVPVGRANLQVSVTWLNPAVEIINLQELETKKIITSSNHVSQNIYH